MSPWRRRLKILTHIAGGLALLALMGGLLADALYPPFMGRLRDHSTLVLASDDSVLRAFATADGAWRFPAQADEIDPKFLRYLKTFEDGRFGWHPGVDPLAVLRAGYQALVAGEVVSGASTLTMQTARLLEPRPRGVQAKAIEALRALQLTWRLGGEGVLKIYLTLAPYGGNLEGIRAASLGYFGKEPRHLTEAEAALLVVLPQSPERLRPDRFPQAAKRARDKVLARLLAEGDIDAQSYKAAVAEAVPSRRLPALSDAPHLAERLRQEMPREAVIHTTIDHDLQRNLQRLLVRRSVGLEAGATIAGLVVGNKDRRVLAYLGSANYFDRRQFGPIDMVSAIRSPGSALKPFIYGMAFDELVVHPETIMVDQPMRFGEWAPENFDHLFRGEISAREALQLSLNLPAVTLMDAIGAPPFAQKLADAGFPLHLPKEAGRPGLPIALGGVGVSLEEMVSLYAGFSEQGTVRALRYIRDQPAAAAKALIGPLGSYYVTRILEDTPPPASWLASANRRQASRIAYKTGTSYGYRDAWAIGYTRDYTIGIWVGRPDGSFSGGRMGRDAAAPLLFEAFDQLPPSDSALPQVPPEGALLVGNTSLPANLKRYDIGPALSSAERPLNRLRIAFPLDGSTVPLPESETPVPLVLKAEGGNLPLRWLVNGKPVTSPPYLRQAQWDPDGKGAQRVTVIDAGGKSVSAEVWLK
ncbi:penicillin-binding protein 1C [Dongia rigui]|uniref:peptidoglycan glycosyltransferase n=1 Tax=Dongia rigui TaxID=940149 RepID=A0ABU5E5Q1_9PROT|nr:penicillin-binding protein 1C [Dongia rigui]MDY0874278.1 penicillin-binding protein 1C [Dongia rigui]